MKPAIEKWLDLKLDEVGLGASKAQAKKILNSDDTRIIKLYGRALKKGDQEVIKMVEAVFEAIRLSGETSPRKGDRLSNDAMKRALIGEEFQYDNDILNKIQSAMTGDKASEGLTYGKGRGDVPGIPSFGMPPDIGPSKYEWFRETFAITSEGDRGSNPRYWSDEQIDSVLADTADFNSKQNIPALIKSTQKDIDKVLKKLIKVRGKGGLAGANRLAGDDVKMSKMIRLRQQIEFLKTKLKGLSGSQRGAVRLDVLFNIMSGGAWSTWDALRKMKWMDKWNTRDADMPPGIVSESEVMDVTEGLIMELEATGGEGTELMEREFLESPDYDEFLDYAAEDAQRRELAEQGVAPPEYGGANIERRQVSNALIPDQIEFYKAQLATQSDAEKFPPSTSEADKLKGEIVEQLRTINPPSELTGEPLKRAIIEDLRSIETPRLEGQELMDSIVEQLNDMEPTQTFDEYMEVLDNVGPGETARVQEWAKQLSDMQRRRTAPPLLPAPPQAQAPPGKARLVRRPAGSYSRGMLQRTIPLYPETIGGKRYTPKPTGLHRPVTGEGALKALGRAGGATVPPLIAVDIMEAIRTGSMDPLAPWAPWFGAASDIITPEQIAIDRGERRGKEKSERDKLIQEASERMARLSGYEPSGNYGPAIKAEPISDEEAIAEALELIGIKE